MIWYYIRTNVCKRTEAVHMDADNCKKIIIELLEDLNESDIIFLQQLYTLIKKHLKRRGGR